MRFFEDIEVGQRRELGSFTFTADGIKKFAAQFDPQRFHLDEEEGRKSLFGGLAASGWHVGSVCMKLLVADGQRQAREAAARGEKVAIWGGSGRFWPAIPSASPARSNRCARRRAAPNGVSWRAAIPAPTSAASLFSRCWRRPLCRDELATPDKTDGT
jgi:hypothetical protein